jgi:hypothetical protein
MVRIIRINRAPVLTLWAAVVAERLGFDWRESMGYGGFRDDASEYLGGTGDGGVRCRKAAVWGGGGTPKRNGHSPLG